jgi:hypothetical protein
MKYKINEILYLKPWENPFSSLKEDYDNLDDFFEKDILETDTNEIKENDKIPQFEYNKINATSHEYKVTFEKIRHKYVYLTYTTYKDRRKTAIALKANKMHFYDSRLMMHIIEKYDIIPIHDCFLMRLSELHLIMDDINEYYSRIIGIKTYSIHIIV